MNYNNLLVLILSLALVLGMTGCRNNPKKLRGLEEMGIKTEVYSNEFYKIEYPKDWEKAELDNEVGFAGPEKKDVNFNIEVFKVKSGVELKKQIYKKGVGVPWLGLEKLEEVDYYDHLIYRGLLRGEEDRGEMLVYYKSGLVFILSFSAEKEDYQDYKNIAKAMINSFELFEFEVKEGEAKTKKTKEVVSSAEAKENAHYLFDRMKEVHPALFFAIEEEEAKRKFEELLTRLEERENWTRLELYRQLARFVAEFEDGHMSFKAPKIFREHTTLSSTVIPLVVYCESEKMIVAKDFSQHKIPPGSEIISINGLKAEKIREDIFNLVSSDTVQGYWGKINFMGFYTYFWLTYGGFEEYKIEYKTKGGEIKRESLRGISRSTYENKINRPQRRDSQNNWKLSFPKSEIAYLRINAFSGDFEQYKKDLENYFAEIEERESEKLIIDLHRNGGGSSAWGNYLYEYITNKPYHFYHQASMKLSDYVLKKGRGSLSQAARTGENRLYTEEYEQEPVSNEFCFEGEVYVLVGPQTASAATSFAAMVKKFEVGSLVGEPAGGGRVAFGNPVEDSLPNSGLVISIPTIKFILAGGYNGDRTITPDIEMEINQSQDRTLKKLLIIIAKD